jgi:hypothetical protein
LTFINEIRVGAEDLKGDDEIEMDFLEKSAELDKIMGIEKTVPTLILESDFNNHAFSSFYVDPKERDELALLMYLDPYLEAKKDEYFKNF